MSNKGIITYQKIRLRQTQENDLDFVIAAETDPQNADFVAQWTRSEHLAALSTPNLLHLIIENIGTNQIVGYIILAGLENREQNIEFRRIVVTQKAQGYGRTALQAVKQFAFEECRTQRLWLDVRKENNRAKHLYLSEGFVPETTNAENNNSDLIIMALSRGYVGG